MIILPSNSSGEYEVANSLRFNSGSSDYLNKTNGTPTNNDICTISLWTKFSNVGSDLGIFSQHTDSNNRFQLIRTGAGYLSLLQKTSGSTEISIATDRLFRDASAWYNIVLAIDTTQGTASNRVKLYINGVQETSFQTETYPSQNTDIRFNSSSLSQEISRITADTYMDGYMTEVVFIDGQQLTPTSFGEFDEDTGIWKPIDVSSLTFGTNGFYLDFENSSSLGADVSGNGNNFTVNNLTSIDQTTDTCTNNFCTMNPLDNYYASSTFSEGNCKIVTSASNYSINTGTIQMTTGKWYAEIEADASNSDGAWIGITGKQTTASSETLGNSNYQYAYRGDTGNYRNNGSNNTYGNTYTTGDIIGIAVDLDNNKLYFSKNGTFQNSGDPTSGATGTGAISITAPSSTPLGGYFFAVSDASGSTTQTYNTNFGNPPFSISSGNSDGNGYGNFEYAVPSGYYALNSKNLSEYG